MKLDDADWPTFGWSADIRPALRAAVDGGRSVVIGTLVRADGPTPRPAGTQMLFDGLTATGYFSGGCLEADVANHAAAVQADGAPRHLVYGQGSPWLDIRLLCGGRIELLLERVAPSDPAVAHLLALERQRRDAWWWSDGQHRIAGETPSAPPASEDALHYTIHYPPGWRVIVIGGDPIALAIAQLAATAGFDSILVRPDGPDGPPPIAPVDYRREPPAAALAALGVDRWTAIVAASHEDALDDAALRAAVGAGAGYIGVLGAAQRKSARDRRLAAAGLSPDQIAVVHAPIGTRRCGKAPWEVAVSVIAEIMESRLES